VLSVIFGAGAVVFVYVGRPENKSIREILACFLLVMGFDDDDDDDDER